MKAREELQEQEKLNMMRQMKAKEEQLANQINENEIVKANE
jgi:hypothetical protein